MKKVKTRFSPVFILIVIMYLAFSAIIVYGGPDMVLLDDSGTMPWIWTCSENRKLGSVSYLKNGPGTGTGSDPQFYYFIDTSDDTREMGSASISKIISFNDNQKMLCSLQQLRMRFSLNYFGWNEDGDGFTVTIWALKEYGYIPFFPYKAVYSSAFINGDEKWRTLSVPDAVLPADCEGVLISISATRKSGSDLDVYLDDIKLSIYDDNLPVMESAAVTEIKDYNGAAVTFKTDGNINWVNSTDTIYGRISFNEPVSVCVDSQNLRTNVTNAYGTVMRYGSVGDASNVLSGYTGSYSKFHEFRIPFFRFDMLKDGESIVKLDYDSLVKTMGPFVYPVKDLGGNSGQSAMETPNIDGYNIRLDNAVPYIITGADSYDEYEYGRTTVDIKVCEENEGRAQSPLTVTYKWQYTKSDNTIEEGKENSITFDTGSEDSEDNDIYNTYYTATINIPTGEDIPDNQDFLLYVKAEDAARNVSGDYQKFIVRQKDMTPPAIIWDKSIHEDGTAVDLGIAEDTAYVKSRTVTFSTLDSESGVEEIKYLWTREPYNAGNDIITAMVLPGEDGRYSVQGTSTDTPLEGMYYLNILATNTTGTSCVVSKGFYFDNEGPQVVEAGSVDWNPTSAQYQVSDRVLQNKFLYTILSSDSSLTVYEPIVEPDISAGIKDDGMWKALELEGTGDLERTANITGVLDKITQSGCYKLVTRYYDEFYNCTQTENVIWYDFIPPDLEVIDAGEPGSFRKNHDIVLKVVDSMSSVNLWGEDFSIDWIDADSGEIIPASYVIEPQLQHISISCSEAFNGKYYLKARASDGAGNTMDEMVFVNGSRAEFCFDNSPPEVTLACDTEKASGTVRFAYSELMDGYTNVSLFKYGISASPDIEPSEWIDISPLSGADEVVYPESFTSDGNWYLSVFLRDTLGNEQIIHMSEPFRIDVTDPSGRIGFVSGYANKLDVPLQLVIDELKSIEQGSFKTILSGDITMLSDAVIADAPPTYWKDITFENGSAIYSWTLLDIPDGEQRVYARFMDEAGNLSSIYEASVILDRTAPAGEVAYDITEPTTGNVTAALTISDNYNVTILNNNQSSTYVFNRNGEFEFVLKDEAGNKTRVKAVVGNIDRDSPEAAVTYSHPRDIWTNQSVTATLNLTDENGCIILEGGTNTHTFNENGEFIFYFGDSLGNQGSMKAEVKNIDKEAPAGSIIYTYSDTAPVTVYLAVYEPVKVTNNEGSFRHIFNENGEFTFEFEDKAGNVASATAGVYTITSAAKYADVIYSDSGRLTNGNVTAGFTAFSGLATLTSPTVTEEVYGPYIYNFEENGSSAVSIRVLSGTEADSLRTVAGSVYNIDRVPPMAEVYISTEEFTNQDVTATLLPYDDKGKTITIMNNGGMSDYVFAENGTFTFDFMDEAGNIGHKAVTVSNIDKSVPEAAIRYFTCDTKPDSVFAEVYFPEEIEEVTILNNNGSDTFEFVENGVFTFRFADNAGNAGTASAQVTDLSDGVSAGTVEYYIDGIKVDDPNKAATNKSVTAKLVLDEAGGPYTVVNNGGSSSYTFEQNGEFTFIYEDSKGNRGFTEAAVSAIDKELPKLQITSDIVKATNQDVTVTVSYSDNKGIAEVLHNMEAENITFYEGKLIYICKGNKTIRVTVSDTAGNVTTKEFAVNYIDKEIPIGTIVYTPNSFTNQDVKAVLTLNEPGLILNNSGRMEYTFIQNGEFTFEFADIAGNSTFMTASVNWIDKLSPAASLEYSNIEMTNKPVIVTLNTEADAVILNNGGAAARTFYTNGEFTFKVMDIAGNETSIKAEVGNIDAEKPQITLNGYVNVSILQNEAYTEAGYSAVDNVDGNVTGNVVVEGSVNTEVPGTYILKYKVNDAVGNSSEETRTVKVVGTDEIALVLNGMLTDGEWAIIDGSEINIDCIGNEGSCVIKWAEGKRTQAYFKTGGNRIAAGGTVEFETGCWYTFFIQDRERKTKSIQIYINE